MSGEVFLGIDVGTSSVKAAVVALGGAVLATASVDHPITFGAPGHVEQNPEEWWSGVLSAIAAVGAHVNLASVSGISVSAQAPTLIPLDRAGRPVRDALIWMDRRAQAEADELATMHTESDYLRERGNRIDPFYVAPKLRWFTRNEPAAAARTATYLQITGWVVYRLTGVLSLDEQHASLLALRAAGADLWSDVALAEAGITADQLPPVFAATDMVGAVTAGVAAITGLRAGTPVIAGTVDSAAAAVEVGAFAEGSAAEMTGTSTVVVMPAADPRPHRAFITMSAPLGGWCALAALVASGASLKWVRSIMAPDQDYAAVTRLAADAPPGSHGVRFVPHLLGERSPLWDSDARGTFAGLSLSTAQADLARAVLEGSAFAIRQNLDIARASGVVVDELRSTGAPTSSDLWCQIKADVTGRAIVRQHAPTGAAYGDAVLAAIGTGQARSADDFADPTTRVDRAFVPDAARTEQYESAYADYIELVDAVTPVYRDAAVRRKEQHVPS